MKFLLEQGADPLTKNQRGETAIQVVTPEWSDGLARFYSGIGDSVGMKVDLDRIQKMRPVIRKLLQAHADKAKKD